MVPAIYQTICMLMAAYAIMFLPAGHGQPAGARCPRRRRCSTTSRTPSGAGPTATFRRVTLPLIAPGLGAGAALVFLAVTTELTATLLLAPIGTQTLATQFWSNSTSIAYGAAAPYAALIVADLAARDVPAHPRSPEVDHRMTALTLRGVTKSFGSTTVLHGVDLDVPARELTAVLGPSGCGKTTLLRLIAGFLDPDAGTIRVRRPGGVRPTGRSGAARNAVGSATCPRRARCSRTSTWRATSASACRGVPGAGHPGARSCSSWSGCRPR